MTSWNCGAHSASESRKALARNNLADRKRWLEVVREPIEEIETLLVSRRVSEAS